ncbi:hypothetical protein [Rathayibacter tanaceti]|uniref:Uncharacterized protein n=2 Tax=Rathayibacter tanaceti TaxID=1671680 RepID=A0A166HPN9_9MICO|nr:hypothetical protein [Rathayibacter tanaceti]KZX20962.1 hypothetical protein ACH61_01911 [Rathayibacter tanaceti]QHC56570.1 hypothetical protein GSU10_13640 [Rathayibacter tanaceti]TCO36787.1 hypothetical protein EV639_106190 [Rathayibacter tanaceti]
MTNHAGHPEVGTVIHQRVALIGLGVMGIITMVSVVVGLIDSTPSRPWLSFVLTIVVAALALGLLPRMRAWRTIPWVSLAMVAVIAGGFITSSSALIGLGALLFVITASVHEARTRRSTDTGR